MANNVGYLTSDRTDNSFSETRICALDCGCEYLTEVKNNVYFVN